MGNNIIVDVSEINAAIQNIKNIQNELSKDTTVINNLVKALKDTKHFTYTPSLKSKSWKSSTIGNKHVRSLTVSFARMNFMNTPAVSVSIEGAHQGLTVSTKHVTTSGCEIDVYKGSKFTSADLGHKIHLIAIGF